MEHSAATTTTSTTTLLRRSTSQEYQNQDGIGTTTPRKSHLNLDTLSSSSSSYTSLKDMLPFSAAAASSATVNSPTAASSAAADISIRNRLVKQAAWAYLQPMSPSPCGPSGPVHFLRRLRLRFSSEGRHRRRNPLSPCFSFVSRIVSCFTRVLQQVLHAIRGQVPIL